MATNNSLNSDGVTIWLAPASTVGTDLSENAKQIESFITNYNEEGGAQDVETVPVFGGGNIDREKPREQKELSFDVILRHNADITVFKDIENGVKISPDGTGSDFIVGMVAVQATDGVNYYYQAYNNASVTVFDTEFDATEEWKGTLKLKLAPTNADGKRNIDYGNADITTDLTSTDNNSW